MQVALPDRTSLITMQVARTFDHSPTSPAQESQFVLTDSQRTGFESPSLIVPGHLPETTPRIDSTGPVRRRRTSKSLSNSALKRSASTPNVRSSQSDIPGNMLNDKKRNKLGYHRTSVACVHCRRRKIRCLMAPDDPQQRCANCIRLKKECNFYPVDQQPPHEKRSRTGSKAEIKSNGNSSASSSPEFAAGATTELVGDTFSPYHTSTMVPQPYPTGPHTNDSSAFSPPDSAAPYTATFDFTAQRQPWDQHNGHHHMQQRHQQQQQQQHYDPPYHPDPSQQKYWHQQPETPISPAYSYPSIPPSDQSSMHDSSAPHPMYGLPRTAEAVNPARSMSFSHVENLHHENDPFHGQVAMTMHDPHQRRATATSDMLPPSLRNSAASSTVSITDVPPITYGGATAMPPQTSAMPFAWTPQAMQHSSQSPKSTEFAHPGTAWSYAEQGVLPKLQEEQEGRAGYVHEPAMLYSNVPHQ